METMPLWAWAGFLTFIAAMLALDLGVFNRKTHVVSVKEALLWCVVWLTLALGFNGVVWWSKGTEKALEFFTGYLVELCLSVDNVFVFIVVFNYFKVPKEFQHRVLFWGILGAVVMRALFIGAGIGLLSQFNWLIALFGLFLIYTGVKLAMPKKEEIEPEKNPAVRLFTRYFPATTQFDGGKFFTIENGRKVATRLFIVLIVIETTDVAFALDSIPAILAITTDAFIVFTSNIFAILGLRSLYFALSGVMQLFRFLNIGLAAILVFIGVKMLLQFDHHYTHWLDWKISIGQSLGVIGGVLAASVILSLMFPEKKVEIVKGPDHPA